MELETGAAVAVVLAPADEGDTLTILDTVPQAGINLAAAAIADDAKAKIEPSGPMNVVDDKGYHSNQPMTTLQEWDVRSYVSEPQRGRRKWKGDTERSRRYTATGEGSKANTARRC